MRLLVIDYAAKSKAARSAPRAYRVSNNPPPNPARVAESVVLFLLYMGASMWRRMPRLRAVDGCEPRIPRWQAGGREARMRLEEVGGREPRLEHELKTADCQREPRCRWGGRPWSTSASARTTGVGAESLVRVHGDASDVSHCTLGGSIHLRAQMHGTVTCDRVGVVACCQTGAP